MTASTEDIRCEGQAPSLWSRIEPHLAKVERPARYINHEYNSASAQDMSDDYRCALMYPDTYELGQANQAIAILYAIVNAEPGFVAERVFLPWIDMIEVMRKQKIPLFSLESCSSVTSFDMLGITLPHTMAATNILEALDLAAIPLVATERSDAHPLVVGGGPEAFNPEPLHAFFDAFIIGEGEEVIVEFVREHKRLKAKGLSRQEQLFALSGIAGVYVPSLYELTSDGRTLAPASAAASAVINKRVVKDFANTRPITTAIVPFAEVAHDRLTVEILRGCSRGCRFCQAGMVYRPVRERSDDMIVESVARGLACTGFDEVSLVSLSSTDHSQIEPILGRLNKMLAGSGVGISLPSQRLDAFGIDMARLVAGEKKTGLTFAPEAGTQRLRDIINKNVSEEDLMSAVKQAYSYGWRRCKLYFMIGLPGECDDDVRGIAELANRAYLLAKDCVPDNQRGNVRMSVSVAVFVPKPHTPFQWCGQISVEEVRRRITLLRESKLHRGIDLNWHDPQTSRIEAAISRCGREGSALIEAVWRCGAKFDAWSECFDADLWDVAATSLGMDIAAMAEREITLDAALPWDHINSGVSKSFLKREYRKAFEALTSEDCTFNPCISCGVCTELDADIVLGALRQAPVHEVPMHEAPMHCPDVDWQNLRGGESCGQ